MQRWIAFLRAINVGGHTVKMEDLRRLFSEQGFTRVESYIASGNMLFDAAETDAVRLEAAIETHLQAALGYEVSAFVRTPAELTQLVRYNAFPAAEMAEVAAFNVAFLKAPLDEEALHRLEALSSEIDTFQVHGRELYWLCRVKQSQSTFSNAVLEKKLGLRATLRGMHTLQKMVARFETG